MIPALQNRRLDILTLADPRLAERRPSGVPGTVVAFDGVLSEQTADGDTQPVDQFAAMSLAAAMDDWWSSITFVADRSRWELG